MKSNGTTREPRRTILIPLVIGCAFFMEGLDSTMIAVAIPDMAESLGEHPLRLNLVITTYLLSLAVFIPLSGWIADRLGARVVFCAAIAIFATGSALCGLSTSLPMMLLMRVVQGFGGAMMTPVGRLILLRSFPRSQLFTAMTYMTLPAMVGPVIGPLLGGVITTYISWRWIFYINIPFGCVGILLALRFFEDVRHRDVPRFDFGGFLMVGAGLALLQYGIENVGRQAIPGFAIAGALAAAGLLLLAFAWHARRVAAPAVDLSLLRQRSFGIATLAGGLSRIGMNGVPFLLPLMLQIGFGMNPAASGSLTFCSSLGALLIRPIAVPLLRWLGFRRVLFWASVLCSAAIAGFALLQPETPRWVIAGYAALYGLIRSVQFMGSNTLAYADTRPERLSRATSLGGVLQQLTVSFGVSAGATLLSLTAFEDAALTPERFHTVFLLLALIPLFALPGFLRLRPEDGREVSGHRHGRGVEESGPLP